MAEGNPSGNLIETFTPDALWACTTCRACQDICPADIEHVNKILEMRRNLALMEGAFPGDEVRTAVSNLEVNGNPFGLAYAARGQWADALGVTTLESGQAVDVLYFVGCYASFDKRNQQVAKSFIAICKRGRHPGGHPWQRRKMLRRTAAETGQRVPVPGDGGSEHRTDQSLRRQADRHHLPALLQYPGPRLQGFGAGYAGGTLQHLRRAA